MSSKDEVRALADDLDALRMLVLTGRPAPDLGTAVRKLQRRTERIQAAMAATP